MYNYELVLINETITEDELGNQESVETRKTVLCKKNSIGTREFYNASVSGMKPEVEFVVHGYEYEGESKVEFEGVKYTVIRTYATDFEEIELTCERVIGND